MANGFDMPSGVNCRNDHHKPAVMPAMTMIDKMAIILSGTLDSPGYNLDKGAAVISSATSKNAAYGGDSGRLRMSARSNHAEPVKVRS